MAELETGSARSPSRSWLIEAASLFVLAVLYGFITPSTIGLVFWVQATDKVAASLYAKEHGLAKGYVYETMRSKYRATSEEAYVAFEALRVADSLNTVQVIRHTIADDFSRRLVQPFRLIHLAFVGVIGLAGMRRAAARSRVAATVGAACLCWCSYIVGTAGIAGGERFGVLLPTRLANVPFLAVLGCVISAPVLAITFVQSRGDTQQTSPVSAFGRLAFSPLPLFTLRGYAVGLTYHEEHSFPVEGGGPSKLSFVDSIIFVLDQKRIGGVSMFRCSAEDDHAALLLIERRLGFLNRVWCLVNVTRPGNGMDLVVKLHRLTPRNLDLWDYSTLRLWGFPVAVIWSVLASASLLTKDGQQEGSQWASAMGPSMKILALGSAVAAIWTVLWALGNGLSLQHAWPAFALSFSPFVVASFIVYMLEAKTPTLAVSRASVELLNTVTQAVQVSIRPILLRT